MMNKEVMLEKLKKYPRLILRFYREQIYERFNLIILSSKIKKHNFLNKINLDAKNILFNTQYPWFYVWHEYLVARQLMNNGHIVHQIICDGLPYCERETSTTKRPSCQSCFKRSSRHASTFGFNPVFISELLIDKDRIYAKDLSYQKSIDQLMEIQHDGVYIGRIAYNNFVHYYKGMPEIVGDVESQFRKIFESAMLSHLAMKHYFDKFTVDVAITANGKFLQTAVLIEQSLKHKIPFVTWEVFTQFTSSIWAKNSLSIEQRLDDIWEFEKNTELTIEKKDRLYENYKQQANSANTPFRYHDPDCKSTLQEINAVYNFNLDKPLIVLYTNVEWDSTAMISSGFSDMLDWLSSAINYAIKNKDYQLVIRAHPGELKVPFDLRTTTPVCDRIRSRFPELPGNVWLIEPHAEISSYALGEMADVVMVYSSTMGIEFALRGIKPWVCAKSYYYGKGFTTDIVDKEDMYRRLDNREFKQRLTQQEKEYAERFAYIVRYRRLFTFPFFKNGKFDFDAYKKSLATGHPVIDNICELIVGDRNALDLGEANW